MKELAFREVIANIKEGEVWENARIEIEIDPYGDFKITFKDGMRKSLYLFDNKKFKLQRQKVSFTAAFKAYEEGKEIESCVTGCKYRKDDKKEYYKELDDYKWLKWIDEGYFQFNEIRGEWYIN